MSLITSIFSCSSFIHSGFLVFGFLFYAVQLLQNARLQSKAVDLEADLAIVKDRLEKLEKGAALKPSDGEQAKPKRARSKQAVALSQDKRPNMKTSPLYRGRRSSLKDDKVQHQVTARPPHKAVGSFTDLLSDGNNSDEASSSNPAANSPSILEPMQANVGSQGIVFRQRREVVNVAENLNEPAAAQAEGSQHEEEDDIERPSDLKFLEE